MFIKKEKGDADSMAKYRKRITTFEEYYADTMRSDAVSDKYVTSRRDWLLSEKKNQKIQNVIEEIPTDELEQVEELGKNSPLSSFIDTSTIYDAYGDELGRVIDNLESKSVLVYYWNGDLTIWQKKDDGMVRIK